MRPNGFSLLELLAVLAVMALGVALIAPAVSNQLPHLALKSEARAVALLLKSAQARAIQDHRAVIVVADLEARRVSAEGIEPALIDKKTGIAVTSAFGAQTQEGDPRFVFFPDGTTTGGRIELARRGAKIFIDANWLTGHVRSYATR